MTLVTEVLLNLPKSFDSCSSFSKVERERLWPRKLPSLRTLCLGDEGERETCPSGNTSDGTGEDNDEVEPTQEERRDDEEGKSDEEEDERNAFETSIGETEEEEFFSCVIELLLSPIISSSENQ